MSTGLDAQTKGFQQAMENTNGALRWQTTEGSYNSVFSILIRMRELAVQSASIRLTNKERAYLDTEFEDLTAEITRISGCGGIQQNQVVGRYSRCIGFDDFQVGAKYSQRPDHHHIGDQDSTALGVEAAGSDQPREFTGGDHHDRHRIGLAGDEPSHWVPRSTSSQLLWIT